VPVPRRCGPCPGGGLSLVPGWRRAGWRRAGWRRAGWRRAGWLAPCRGDREPGDAGWPSSDVSREPQGPPVLGAVVGRTESARSCHEKNACRRGIEQDRDVFDDLIDADRSPAARFGSAGLVPAARWRRALVTCMDTRREPLAALSPSSTKILGNAGGPLDPYPLRYLWLDTHLLSVERWVVVHHTGCALAGAGEAHLGARPATAPRLATGVRWPTGPCSRAVDGLPCSSLDAAGLARLRRVTAGGHARCGRGARRIPEPSEGNGHAPRRRRVTAAAGGAPAAAGGAPERRMVAAAPRGPR
jgi:hypothetical protein